MLHLISKHTIQVPGGKKLVLWGITENLNYFLNDDLEPDVEDGPNIITVAVPKMNRRQYPGDTSTYEVKAHTRRVLRDPASRNGSALPGRNFYLAERPMEEGRERRQFTYQGAFVDLHSFIFGQANTDLTLYNASGKAYMIDEAGANPITV